MDALTIIGCILAGMIVLAIFVPIGAGVPDWRLRRWERRDAYSQLLTISGKGYSWAIIPRNRHDYDTWDQFRRNNIYVQAKEVEVDCIGRLPNGNAVFKTQCGDRFYLPHYSNHDITSVLIDSARNVYTPVPSESELIDNRLVVLSDDIIIPNNYHVTSNPKESKNFQSYYSCLSTYFGDEIPYLNHTELMEP